MDMKEKRHLIQEYKENVDQMIRNKQTEQILPFLQENMDIIKHDNELMTVWYLGMMTKKEIAAGKRSVFEKENSLKELLIRYNELKFYLRRIEYDIMEDANEFYAFLSEKKVSEYELMGMIDSVNYNKAKVKNYFM